MLNPAPASPLSKLKPLDELGRATAAERAKGETVVLAHGTFDLLHIGHVRHLRDAKKHGTALVVTITADAFVNKGPGRPVFSEHMRAEMLAALEFVDYVGIVHDATAIPAITPTARARRSFPNFTARRGTASALLRRGHRLAPTVGHSHRIRLIGQGHFRSLRWVVSYRV